MSGNLKEFEKWWREDYSKQKFWEPEPPSCIAECAWKAALEWAKDNCDLYDRCGGWQGYIIEEELNAKTQKEP